MSFRRKNIRLHPIHYQGRRWFFITICCESRDPVFTDPKNALDLISCLKTTAERRQFGVHAFCVMPDHFHALLEGIAPESDLLLFVQNFKQASSRKYAKSLGAPLWQKKFYDHILRPKDSPEAVSWYIWMNPVRKGSAHSQLNIYFPVRLPKSGGRSCNPRRCGRQRGRKTTSPVNNSDGLYKNRARLKAKGPCPDAPDKALRTRVPDQEAAVTFSA
jgi:putative transposase